MTKMVLFFFVIHFFHLTVAVSHNSSSSATPSDFSKGPEKVIEKQRNLRWGKSVNLLVVDKKELIRRRNIEYSRRYRKLHPDRLRESGQKYHANIRKDPIKWHEKRMKRKTYNAKYRQRLKLARDIQLTTDEKDIKDHSNKLSVLTGKRKQITDKNHISSKRPRILHYGRPPMSNAFIPPEPKYATDRESAIHPTHTANENEAHSQRPSHIVRIKLAKPTPSATQGPSQNGTQQQSTA